MEVKDLNIIPSGDMPVIHASQFDVNRVIKFNLKEDGEDYTLESGITITCAIKKVDGNLVTFEVTNTEGKYIEMTLPEQATACAGINVGEVIFTDEDNYEIGSINFILDVERSPKQGGIESASSIHDLTEQIEEITTEIIGNDYYTKSQVDELLEGKADLSDIPDMSDYYNKTQTDTLLYQKANVSQLPDMSLYYSKTQTDSLLFNKADKSNTYTKSEIDSALALKANLTDLPDMSNYYTKSQVDQKFIDILPVNSASGSIANFTTSLALPLVALKAYINAQGGGGTPSAPVAITGFDNVKIYQRGGNLWDEEWESGTYNSSDGRPVPSENAIRSKNLINIKPNVNFAFYNSTANIQIRVYYFDKTEAFLSYTAINAINNVAVFTTPANACYMLFAIGNSTTPVTTNNKNLSINGSTTDTQYHAYNPNSTEYTIQLGQTVYGGYVDKGSGKLVITNVKKKLRDFPWSKGNANTAQTGRIWFHSFSSDTTYSSYRGGLCDSFTVKDLTGQAWEILSKYEYCSTSSNFIFCVEDDYSTYTDMLAVYGDVEFTVILRTPIETDITIPDITALVGENNIFADTGNIDVSFKQGIQEYIDSKIAETQALIL